MKTLGFPKKTVASLLVLMTLSAPAQAEEIGKVAFDTSCTNAAQPLFERGLVMLHHMMYTHAAMGFEKAAEVDPDCAMAQWGIAMSKFHPLWPGGPTPQETQAGGAAAAKLAVMETGTPLEAAFVSAALAFYAGDEVPYRARLAAWAAAQQAIMADHPDHDEVVAFHALAQLTAAPRGPAGVPELRKVGAAMDALRASAPEHPAGYHYAIHAYDNPVLAQQGLEPSRTYQSIAPENPHALHMPTHIFTRLGLWQESLDLNERSAAAVINMSGSDVLSGHYIHAIDYAIYAALQMGQVNKAQALLAEMEGHANHENVFGTAYAAAAAPSRISLEQGDWAAAANLPTSLHDAVSWERYPQAVAMRWFAIGIGAARSDDAATAQNALSELAKLRAVMEERDASYWLELHSAQTGAIEAWLAHAKGDTEAAIAMMQEAADTEDMAGKAPVTPGHVLPVRELLGDLLLESGDTEGAEAAYQLALSTSPNRLRSLQGLEHAQGN